MANIYMPNWFLMKVQKKFNGKNTAFSINDTGTDIQRQKNIKLDLSLTLYRIINSKWIMDLNVRNSGVLWCMPIIPTTEENQARGSQV